LRGIGFGQTGTWVLPTVTPAWIAGGNLFPASLSCAMVGLAL
jgi:hypothetical protein